jgi:hypothetical protein
MYLKHKSKPSHLGRTTKYKVISSNVLMATRVKLNKISELKDYSIYIIPCVSSDGVTLRALFGGSGVLNSEPCACWTGVLPLESHIPHP